MSNKTTLLANDDPAVFADHARWVYFGSTSEDPTHPDPKSSIKLA
jgi:hypothetical protein